MTEPLTYRTTLRLPPSLAKRIKKEAKKSKMREGECVREILDVYFMDKDINQLVVKESLALKK